MPSGITLLISILNLKRNFSLSKPSIYHYRVTEVPGNDEDVVYDKLEANITIQLVRETVDNQVKLVAKVSYPEDSRYL